MPPNERLKVEKDNYKMGNSPLGWAPDLHSD